MSSKSKLTNIQKRKRLEALYERGENVTFGPEDEQVAIFVGPCSPLQREMAIREAQAQRSRAMLEARTDDTSGQALNARSFISGLNLDELIEYITSLDESDRTSRARRDVLALKEWEDFNSLRDSMRQFEEAGSPVDDPEWAPLMKRDAQFGDQVLERIEVIREGDIEGLKLMPRDVLEKRAFEKRVEQAGSNVFMKVYEDYMLFYSCRDDEEHSELFFDSVEDLRSMPEEVQDSLETTLAKFITEAAEAKNSPPVVSGSTSSDQSNEPETSPSSTPEDAIGF